jgi:hypothetical protein
MSRFFTTDSSDPLAPVLLEEWRGLRPGMAVVYVGRDDMPTANLTIAEIVEFPGDGFESGWVTAILNDGEYEVDASNLRAAFQP